jgi:hypothetical protein
MAITTKQYQEAIQTFTFNGTQTLNSLTDGEWTDESTNVINNAAGYPFADWELVVGSAAYGTGSYSHFLLYLLPQPDGTNYADFIQGNTTNEAPEVEPYFAGAFHTTGTTAAQRLALLNTPLPDGNFIPLIRNQATASTPASGNTLKYRRWAWDIT